MQPITHGLPAQHVLSVALDHVRVAQERADKLGALLEQEQASRLQLARYLDDLGAELEKTKRERDTAERDRVAAVARIADLEASR